MKNKSSEVKKNKIKNYMILVSIFLLSIFLVLYLCELYKVDKNQQLKIPVIDGVLLQIYPSDLEHYITDNPTTVIYMCTADNEVCRNFERDFKKLLKKKDYSNQIIYLNLTDLEQDQFIGNFNNKYPYRSKLTTNYPAFVLFEDGKIKSIIQGKDNKTLKIDKVKQFLELNEIGD